MWYVLMIFKDFKKYFGFAKSHIISKPLHYSFLLFTIVGSLNQKELEKGSIFCLNNYLENTIFLGQGIII